MEFLFIALLIAVIGGLIVWWMGKFGKEEHEKEKETKRIVEEKRESEKEKERIIENMKPLFGKPVNERLVVGSYYYLEYDAKIKNTDFKIYISAYIFSDSDITIVNRQTERRIGMITNLTGLGVEKLYQLLQKVEKTDNLFKDIKKKYNNLIINDTRKDRVEIEYHNIPYILYHSTNQIDGKPILLLSSKQKYNSRKWYVHSEETKVIDHIDEFEEELDAIEDILLYDLSNFKDAFDSIIQVPINGYIIDKDSISVNDDYTLHFTYKNNLNDNKYIFSVKPFDKYYKYKKNDLREREGTFDDFANLMEEIDSIINESKRILPFEYEQKPNMYYNPLTGQLELDKKELPYNE